MLIEPLLVAFTYEMLYDKLMRKGEWGGIVSFKTSQETYGFGFLIALINDYL